MKIETSDELISNAINDLTEKVSEVLLKKFLKLPKELQLNIVLIKTTQLLLANVLCQVVANKEELEKIVADQGAEMRELVFNCAFTAFSDKFDLRTH